jgi:hypothetical protein
MGDEAEAALKELGAEIAPVRIHQRVAFVHAQKTGKVTQEIKDLYHWIKRKMPS